MTTTFISQVVNYPSMVYIAKVKSGNKTFYYAQRNERVNGKPIVVWRMPLGTAENIVKVFEGKYLDHIEFKTFDFGLAASILSVSEELGFINIVNQFTEKKQIDGLSVGEYLLLMIMARCYGPYSKRSTSLFFEHSFLNLVWKVPHKLNSQNFINHMGYIDNKAMDSIGMELAKKLVGKGFDVKYLIWDTTNFSTNIEGWDSELLKSGNAKDKRFDRNLVGLGIGISQDNLPIIHETFPGNEHDAKLLEKLIQSMVDKLKQLKMDVEKIVFVMDTGNNSEENIETVLNNMHIVGGLKRNQVPELMEAPLEKYEILYTNRKGHVIRGYKTEKEIYGRNFRIVVTYNEMTRKRQLRTYKRTKKRILEEMKDIVKRFARDEGRGRKMTVQGAEAAVHDLIPKNLRAVFHHEIDKKTRKISFDVVEDKESELMKSFGKKAIFTDLFNWSPKKIAKAYNQKAELEDDFKLFKGKLLIPVVPVFHQEDEPIKVHVFLCVLGMLFVRYMRKRVASRESLPRALEELKRLRVALIQDTRSGEAQLKVEQMNQIQARFFSALGLEKYLVLRR